MMMSNQKTQMATKPSPTLFSFQPSLFDGIASASLLNVATEVSKRLIKEKSVTTAFLATCMTNEYGKTDAEGGWNWKKAYDGLEMALVLYVRKQFSQLSNHPRETIVQLQSIQNLLPTHTKRSEDTNKYQMFSTPLPLAYLVGCAAKLSVRDTVLEPSSGTGLLAVWAQTKLTKLILNELNSDRLQYLKQLFPSAALYQVDAEHINDLLPDRHQPSVVLMNPPFSASHRVNKRYADATINHVKSALYRLRPGGRLVTITADWFSPTSNKWREPISKLPGKVVFSAGIDGLAYYKHGTTIETRLTVIDKVDKVESQTIINERSSHSQLASLIEQYVPSRSELKPVERKLAPVKTFVPRKPKASIVNSNEVAIPTATFTNIVDVEYEVVDWSGIKESLNDGIYERYTPQSVVIQGAKPHPTKLVESTAMNAIAPPKPTYIPKLPMDVITTGALSDAQLESVIYAGNSHEQFLPDWFVYDHHLDQRQRVKQGTPGAVRYRKAWFNGDHTGVGKGRQCGGIILDNWLKGRKKAIWISKNAPLLEDTRRDWQALGGEPQQVVPLSNYKQGEEITISEGILFVTYGTLRTPAKGDKISRVDQIVQWLGVDSDAVVIFDEAHSMSNAMATQGGRGTQKPSQQGLAGLRLQYILHNARFVYVSATGASKLENLSYLERLGLWNSEAFPFADRDDFLSQVEQGGIAALEVLARDLKAMGLYLARSVSFDGVEYEILQHDLTPAQVEMYNKYAQAYQIIHQNIHKAIETTNAKNGRAKLNAYSKFEGAKQRFFNHLITSIKCPTLIKSIEKDLEAGHSAVIQLVSTDEALLDRRLASIPTNEWKDIKVDITPREYLFDYLINGFPVILYETYTDENGNEHSRIVRDAEGNPIVSSEALKQREELLEQLVFLPPLPSALDQIINYFGYENVAEVTGRSKRLVRVTTNESGAAALAERDRTEVQRRSLNANIAETQAFMDGRKRILVFSQAGGTGRSYHCDRQCQNQSKRIHVLLESGWRAESAIQGLGRTNRSNQVNPPLYRVITTNIQGEKRFTSTIARRLHALGAITKGERKTGGQGLFGEEDNLESVYALHALRQLYSSIAAGNIEAFSLQRFEQVTGLSLNFNGELPPMKTFLNRLLGLTLEDQQILINALELLIHSSITKAKEGGYYEMGVETLKAHRFRVLERTKLYQDQSTGGISYAVRIEKTVKNSIMTYDQARWFSLNKGNFMAINTRSGRAAVVVNTNSSVDDDGSVSQRVHLYRPDSDEKMTLLKFTHSQWRKATEDEFKIAWEKQVASVPKFKTKTFYLITGLLLPIWKKLDPMQMKIYRVHLDNGEQLLGRLVAEDTIAAIASHFNVKIKRTAREIYGLALNSNKPIPITQKLSLKASKVMGNIRLEIVGFSGHREFSYLKELGAMSELIAHQLRLFIATTDEAIQVIEKIQHFYDNNDRFLG